MSSNIYRTQDAPWYRLGHSVVLGYLTIGLLGGSVANLVFLQIGNQRRDRLRQDERDGKLSGLSEEDQHHLADFHPDFRYTL
jgi:hypothetical protein